MSRQSHDLRRANERHRDTHTSTERERERERERETGVWSSSRCQSFSSSSTRKLPAFALWRRIFVDIWSVVLLYRAKCRERFSSAGSDVDLTAFVSPIRAADLMSNEENGRLIIPNPSYRCGLRADSSLADRFRWLRTDIRSEIVSSKPRQSFQLFPFGFREVKY